VNGPAEKRPGFLNSLRTAKKKDRIVKIFTVGLDIAIETHISFCSMAFSIDLKFIFVVSGLLTAQSPRDVFRYTSIKNRFHDLMPNKIKMACRKTFFRQAVQTFRW
jgi:hypothetical protein